MDVSQTQRVRQVRQALRVALKAATFREVQANRETFDPAAVRAHDATREMDLALDPACDSSGSPPEPEPNPPGAPLFTTSAAELYRLDQAYRAGKPEVTDKEFDRLVDEHCVVCALELQVSRGAPEPVRTMGARKRK